MTSTIQPGMHPDAESLTAFAEQLLPAAESEQILAHMATCGRCREVVFLAQKAAGEDEPGIAPVYTHQRTGPGSRWFASWRWTWVPVAALAGMLGVAVELHFRHTSEPEPVPQMAGNVAPSDTGRETEQPAAPLNSTSTEPVQEPKEKALASPQKTPAREVQKDAAKQLDEATEGAANALGVIGGIAGGSTRGTALARRKGQSIGGPMANQFEQNANQVQQQNLPPQNAAKAPRKTLDLSADKLGNVNASPGTATETVTVQAEAPQETPAPASRMTLSAVANETIELKGRQIAGVKKAEQISLPSGTGVLSSASSGGRTIALDTAGALFVREGNQKHWQAVSAQWTGRAVLVRTRPMPGAAQDAPAFAVVENPRFELVTDKLETWVSADGKAWTAEPLPAK